MACSIKIATFRLVSSQNVVLRVIDFPPYDWLINSTYNIDEASQCGVLVKYQNQNHWYTYYFLKWGKNSMCRKKTQ